MRSDCDISHLGGGGLPSPPRPDTHPPSPGGRPPPPPNCGQWRLWKQPSPILRMRSVKSIHQPQTNSESLSSGVFPKWEKFSLNSANSGNQINQWSTNWTEFKDPVPHMCCAGAVVACWSLTQEVAGVRILLLYCHFFCHWIQRIHWKHLGKNPLGMRWKGTIQEKHFRSAGVVEQNCWWWWWYPEREWWGVHCGGVQEGG